MSARWVLTHSYDDLFNKATKLHVYDSKLGKPSTYLLPKINKLINIGCSIVSGCPCPKINIYEFLNSIFQTIVTMLPSFMKDTNYAFILLYSTKVLLGQRYHRFLLNVFALQIHPSRWWFRCCSVLSQHRGLPYSTSNLVPLTELVLTLNFVEFNGEYFDQIAMLLWALTWVLAMPVCLCKLQTNGLTITWRRISRGVRTRH